MKADLDLDSGLSGALSLVAGFADVRGRIELMRAMYQGALLLLLLLIGGSPALGQTPAATAFVDVAVVPMDRQRVLTHQTVVIQGARIAAIGAVNKVAIPIGAIRIDGHGKFLIPGLVDMHAHVTMGWRDEEDTASVHFAEHALTRYLASGVTTIRDMDGSPLTLALKSQAARHAILSPQIYVSVRPGMEGLNYLSTQPAEAVRRAKQAGFDLIKFWNAPKGEELDSIIAAARQVGLPIAGHPPGQGDNLLAIKIGYASVEHLLGLWNVSTDDSLHVVAAMFKRANLWVCPTLLHVAQSFKSAPEYHQVAAYHAAKVFSDDGVGILAGTDDAWGPERQLAHSPFLYEELEALVAAGLTPYQALVTATRNPATYFGTLSSAGTVAVGRQADLVLLSGNPLKDIRYVSHQAGVMADGRWFPRAELDRILQQLPQYSPEEIRKLFWILNKTSKVSKP